MVRIEEGITPMYNGSYLICHQIYQGREDEPCSYVQKIGIGIIFHNSIRIMKVIQSDFVAATGIGAISRYYIKNEDLIETVEVETLNGTKRMEINHGNCLEFSNSYPNRLIFDYNSNSRYLYSIDVPYEEIDRGIAKYKEKEKKLGIIRNILGDIVQKNKLKITCIMGAYFVSDEWDHSIHSTSYKTAKEAEEHLRSLLLNFGC